MVRLVWFWHLGLLLWILLFVWTFQEIRAQIMSLMYVRNLILFTILLVIHLRRCGLVILIIIIQDFRLFYMSLEIVLEAGLYTLVLILMLIICLAWVWLEPTLNEYLQHRRCLLLSVHGQPSLLNR